MSIIITIINFIESKIEFSIFCSYGTKIFNILNNTTELWMTKYIIGEFFSSGDATLYKNSSDQTVPKVGNIFKQIWHLCSTVTFVITFFWWMFSWCFSNRYEVFNVLPQILHIIAVFPSIFFKYYYFMYYVLTQKIYSSGNDLLSRNNLKIEL